VFFWRNMYEELHARTGQLLSQNVSSAVDPLLQHPTHTPASTIVASPSTRPFQLGGQPETLRDSRPAPNEMGESEHVKDLHREISSLRKTLQTVQQAKVDTETAWGGVARVESRIDNAWCVRDLTMYLRVILHGVGDCFCFVCLFPSSI
jgi:hypothetical protein